MLADAVVVADIAKGQTPELDAAMQGAQALIIASSAVPQVSFSLAVWTPGAWCTTVGSYVATSCNMQTLLCR